MNNNQKNLLQEDNTENSNINIRDLVDKYLTYWKWFALSVLICLTVAFYNLNFSRPQYRATSTIKLNDEKSGDRTPLSAFSDLGIMSSPKDKVEDEIEIIKSKNIISEAIKSLKFNVQFFTDKNYLSEFLDDNLFLNSEFYETERYKSSPLKINFILTDSSLYKISSKFIISINSSNQYTYIPIVKGKKAVAKKHSFGERMNTNFGDIIITPNVDLKKDSLIGENVLVNILTVSTLTNYYSAKLKIEPKSEFSSVLSLTIEDGVKQKAEDFLNELVVKYNDRAISLKDKLTINTSDFVNKRLKIISDELSNVDLSVESLKTRYRISDVASETGMNMQSGQVIENQIVQASAQLEKIGYIKDFVETKEDDELIPVDVGVADNSISSTMQQYNLLMMEKKRLLENSTDKNPIVVNISEQLKTLKENINQGLNNIESSQKISLDALNRQDARINSRLYSAPKQERQYRDIQRQQQIKEALYLYLLQKREETAITLGVADPNAKVIDHAESLPNPVAPKKTLIFLMAGVIGLLIPIGVGYVIDLLDSKIHTKEEVEKILNIPIIGDIPKLETKAKYLIKNDDYSSIAEAFRILRTNLNFILPNSNDKIGKVVFVTSTIAHEGKSFVSSNLATVIAHAGKKVLILGLDIRAPKIKQYVGVRGKHGITNFIINSELSPDDVIINSPNIKNLDIISSGDIAPNPAELLMNPRLKELFDFVKQKYDYIIVDTAAYSMVTDTLLISNFADAFIYVIRANFLDKRVLQYIKSLYKEKRLPNMALLINGIDYKKAYGYGYGYGYGYASKIQSSKKKKWWNFIS